MQADTLITKSRKRRISAAPITIASIALVIIAWMIVVLDSDRLLDQLSDASSTVRSLANNTALLFGGGFVLSLLGISISSILLMRKPHIFLALWAYFLSISDAKIPVLQPVSLALRYPMMVSLLLLGVFGAWKSLGKWNLVQASGLVILLLCLSQLVINPVDAEALLLLPMQLAMFVGIFYGLPLLINTPEAAKKLGYSLAWVGVLSTIINYLSFLVVPNVFIAGRFTSWFPLPTGFATNFVLCITPLIWAFLDSRSPFLKLIFSAFIGAAMILILLSGTRNAMLATVVVGLIFVFLWKRKLLIYALVLGAVAVLLAFVLRVGLSDIGQAGSRIGQVSQTEVRYSVWAKTWGFILEHPIKGYGLSVGLQNLDKKAEAWELFNTHNAFLGIWIRMGVIAVLVYLVIYLKSFFTSLPLLIKQKLPDYEKSSLVLFFCLLIELFITGLFEENLSSRASIFQAIFAISAVMIFIEANRLRKKRTVAVKAEAHF